MQQEPEYEKWFRNLYLGNPLRNRDQAGRALIAGLLEHFLELESQKKTGVVGGATKIRRYIEKLKEAQAAYQEVSESPLLQSCNPEHRTYAHMRDVEIAITESARNGLARAGKDVYVSANVVLAAACESMRVSEGRVDYIALEELLGQIRTDAKVISAESLRERVSHLEKHYPEVYRGVPLLLQRQPPEAPINKQEEIEVLEQARKFILSVQGRYEVPSCLYPGRARWRPHR